MSIFGANVSMYSQKTIPLHLQSQDSKAESMKTQLILKRPVHLALEARREKEAVRRMLTF